MVVEREPRDFAFETLGLDRLSVVLQAENARSVAVAQRIGGELRGEAEYHGQRVTHYVVRPQPSGVRP
jgi:RimJ/RimL family protein N-acetyltransferase